jgi:undecaprenyl diphosphate synthase
VPRHIAIIMDGNGRWAHERGLARTEGHRAGTESVRAVVEACLEVGVAYLTLYAFSTENWSRPRGEVRFLMSELRRFLRRERSRMVEQGVRLKPIGRIGELPAGVQRELARAVEATRDCGKLTVCLALNYGGRTELVDACRAIGREVASGSLAPEAIEEETICSHLYTAGLPDPDLLIRTSGEHRLSNFLLWQVSYSELYVSRVYWPDFRREHLRRAVAAYGQRERRYGGVRGGGG